MAHKTVRSITIQSPVIRGAYFYLHETRKKDGAGKEIPVDKQKYEFVGLIPKLNADATKCANYMLFANTAMSIVPQVPEWGGQYPPGGNWPIKDGDLKAAKYPWMAGHWVINFSGNFAPKVALLQNGQPTEIPARRIGATDLYKSGDYCVVSTYAFSYDNQSRGVKFDMEGVCFVGVGEPIGASQRAVGQMFEGLASGGTPMPVIPSAPTSAPVAPAAPVAPSISTTPPVQQYAPPTAQPPAMAPPMAPMPPQAPQAPQAPQYAAPGLPPMPPAPLPR